MTTSTKVPLPSGVSLKYTLPALSIIDPGKELQPITSPGLSFTIPASQLTVPTPVGNLSTQCDRSSSSTSTLSKWFINKGKLSSFRQKLYTRWRGLSIVNVDL